VPGGKLSLVFDPDTLWPGATKLFDLSKLKTVKWGGKEHRQEYIFWMANSRGDETLDWQGVARDRYLTEGIGAAATARPNPRPRLRP